MARRINQTMNSGDQGLTVGQLTIAIGTLIIAGLIWSTFVSEEKSKNQSSNTFPGLTIINS